MSVYHPDILEFITSKSEEGKMSTTNISVVADDEFMRKVKNDEEYQTYFDYSDHREHGPKYKAKDVFDLIVEGAWKNGEPGILLYDTINNNTPFKYAGIKIDATNPCG